MSISILAGSIVVEQFGSIRVTDDGLLSVYDLIDVCAEYGSRKSRYEAWKRLVAEHSDLSSKIGHFKFEGRAQKETPVCNKETALEILGLLPGATGRKYRQLAAKLVLSYLESPDQLAKAAIARTEAIAPDKLDDIIATAQEAKNRVDGVNARKSYTERLKERGKDDYATATNTVYDAMFGLRAKDIKRLATGDEKAKGSARDYLKDRAIKMLELIEGLAADVSSDTGEDVVELAARTANQMTGNLDESVMKRLKDFRDKPLTPGKARKILN